MDVNKLGPGQRIAAGAAVLLFIDLFLNWYSAGGDGFSVSVNAWDAFGGTDFLLALTAIVAIVMAAQAMGMLSLPIKLSTVLLPLAGVMAVWVLYRLLNQPGPNDLVSNEFGAYLGFLLTAAIAYGAYRAQNEHEDVAAPGTYKVGSKTGTTPTSGKSATTPPPAAPTTPPPAAPTTPAPGAPPPAGTTNDPPPPPASTTL
ncbi:MAG: hypothetical protein WKF96_13455 [Solirubrobacteraceae bacterium]